MNISTHLKRSNFILVVLFIWAGIFNNLNAMEKLTDSYRSLYLWIECPDQGTFTLVNNHKNINISFVIFEKAKESDCNNTEHTLSEYYFSKQKDSLIISCSAGKELIIPFAVMQKLLSPSKIIFIVATIEQENCLNMSGVFQQSRAIHLPTTSLSKIFAPTQAGETRCLRYETSINFNTVSEQTILLMGICNGAQGPQAGTYLEFTFSREGEFAHFSFGADKPLSDDDPIITIKHK